jgi:hypothetical protein
VNTGGASLATRRLDAVATEAAEGPG